MTKIKTHFTRIAARGTVLLTLFSVFIATAPAETAVLRALLITGQVRDAHTRNPMRLARLELWRGGTPLDQQYTDNDGRFRFAPIVGGRYTVTIDSSGYQHTSVDYDVPSSGSLGIIELIRTNSSPKQSRPVVDISEYLAPSSARKELARARKEAKRDCAKAIPHFEKALPSFGKDTSAHNDLGNCYRNIGDLDRAEQSFKRARALSDSIYVVLNLAELYSLQKRFKEAEAVLSDVIQKQPAAGDAYYGLSLVYIAAGQFDLAETAALLAHAKAHAIPDVHLILATLYANKNQQAQNRSELELYLKEAPNGAMSGRVRERLKRLVNR